MMIRRRELLALQENHLGPQARCAADPQWACSVGEHRRQVDWSESMDAPSVRDHRCSQIGAVRYAPEWLANRVGVLQVVPVEPPSGPTLPHVAHRRSSAVLVGCSGRSSKWKSNAERNLYGVSACKCCKSLLVEFGIQFWTRHDCSTHIEKNSSDQGVAVRCDARWLGGNLGDSGIDSTVAGTQRQSCRASVHRSF